MKKMINKIALTLVAGAFVFVSCDQDVSVPDIDRANSTAAVVVEESISVTEGGDPTFTLSQEELIMEFFDDGEAFTEVSGQIGIRVIGGTATEGVDYEFTIGTIQDFSPFLLQDGYYYEFDATTSLENTVSGIIDVIADTDTEGAETIELQFFPAGLGMVVINDVLTITIND